MVIYPEVIVTPDTPTVKFSSPREQVDLDKELPRILSTQGWGCGTFFNVIFTNHEKTKLLSCARFVVTEEIENVQTNDSNPYQPITKTVYARSAAQLGEWWIPPVVQDSNVTSDTKVDTNTGADQSDPVPALKRKAAR